ncbi:GGDEF domain-containing protein [Clostridium sp. DSM 100503]|uniref:GGDEF domain-containing protein n=1 Tax=Clostridium sp. DSM 100503 TaxID=2963282 RepID=UPI002149F706|nr:GGDEF domain-containing protein [Clostridium sp. DSM 100503]MCR1951793.1 GGDEF domain-containing protein [Clostridium sp. DSM 100503]
MDKIIQTQVNIMSLFTLLMLIFHSYVKLDMKKLSNKLFVNICSLISVILVLEILKIFVSINILNFKFIFVNKLINTLLFITSPIPLYMWNKYLSIWMSKKIFIPKTKISYFEIPLVINTILLIINLKYDIIFSISNSNLYQHENFFITPLITCAFYYINSYLILIKERNNISRDNIKFLHILYILPILAFAIQLLIPQCLFLWASITTILVFTYILVQQELLETDPLTEAFNRNYFNSFISKVNTFNINLSELGALNIDLDDFKSINDTYGHQAGDDVLKDFVLILNKSFGKKSKIIRMGGDEFIIILENTSEQKIETKLNLLNSLIESHNSHSKYTIKFSFAYCIYSNDFDNIYDFFNCIDNKMYQNKYLKKSANIK